MSTPDCPGPIRSPPSLDGQVITAPPAQEGKGIDLMAALRQSVEEAKKERASKNGKAAAADEEEEEAKPQRRRKAASA